MTKTSISRLTLGVCGFLLFSTAASAYVLLSPPRRWFPADMARVVHVDDGGLASVNDADHGVSQAVIAVERWNGGPSGTVVDGVAGSVVYTLGDGRSDLIFGDPVNLCTGSCLAATTVGYYNDETACCDALTVRRYTDSDVAYNLSFSWTSEAETDGCSGEFSLEAVTTHEVGHLIGLGHSGTSSALMYPSVSSCNNKPLSVDDTNGSDALYECGSFTLGSCGGGSCKAAGQGCTANSECCSGNCKGKPGRKTCK